MPRFLRHLIGIIIVILVAGCAGGGCSSGCSGCGMTPLPGGFDPNARVENAGSVRLTQSGLGFIEQNLPSLAKQLLGGMANGGVLTFNVPSTSGSQSGVQYDVCPGGPNPNANPPKCVAEVDIGNAKLNVDTSDPHEIRITGPLPIRLQNLPIHIVYLFIPDDATARLTGNECNDPPQFANINLDVDISIEVDTNMSHARYGYSRVKVNKLGIDENALKDSLNFCGGGFSNFVLGVAKGILFNSLVGPLLGTLQGQIDQQLCQQANPMASPTCPLGTTDVNGVCRYGTTENDECAPILLGTDGHMDLGGLLASVSPGTKAGLDMVFAVGGSGARPDGKGAWGDLNPIAGGATLGMYGGAEAQPVSGCVKFSDMKPPTGIPVPDELNGNTLGDWPGGLDGPHVGIALSERFANYALNGVYNSGLLCLGISTETVPQLSSGTLSLLANSLKDLGLQREAQQVALTVRPNQPPKVTFGNGTDLEKDPVLKVQLNKISFDFYIWSLDRFVRFMTATFDIEVPVNLTVTKDGLQPVLKTINVTNGVVTNSELLKEDPAVIAASLQGLLGGLAGQFLGGINPIDLSGALSSVGLTLTIPETVDGKGSPGLRRLTKDTDSFLGIFATLGVAPAMPFAPGGLKPAQESETEARVVDKRLDRGAFRLATMRPDNAPVVSLQMSSPLDNGTRVVEYSYRIDRGAWHPFTRDRRVDVRDEWLRLQGKHVISVASRVAGEPLTLDSTPAQVEVVIDAEPPTIAVGEVQDGKLALDVRDPVSGGSEPELRYRLDEGAWSAWMPASAAHGIDVGQASDIAIEAKDSEGNVASASQALIRGRVPLGDGSGCGCTVVGADQSQGKAFWLVALAVLGAVLRVSRRPARAAAAAKPVASAAPTRGTARAARRTLHALTALSVMGVAGSMAGCSCGGDDAVDSGYHCSETQNPPCVTLEPGLIGAYTSVAVKGSTIWVAGYVEANWANDNPWGDLAVGTWDGAKVAWSVIDGVPSEPPVDPALFNKNAFRGGQTEPGDDVGLWTSIGIDTEGNPAVAYYDRTHKALKFAQKFGTKWNAITVETKANADVGRYAKLLFVSGKPVIAYLSIEPGTDGAVSSKVRLATSASATPTENDWTFEDVAVDMATPCRVYNCADGTACVKQGGKCLQKQSGCNPDCGSGQACVDLGSGATCSDIVDSTKLDTYPDAVGDYISMAPNPAGGVGIAFYDRIHGNVVIASNESGSWKTMVVDGAGPDGTDTGDMGIGTSLFIDDKGDWHLSYVDGLSEGLRYAQITKGTTVKVTSLVDDGLTVDGSMKFDDGQHLVGDDSHIFVAPSGDIHVTYQDATAGKLRYAVGTPSGDKITWKVRALDQDGFAGAFSHPVQVDSKMMLVNWWRVGGLEPKGDVAVLTP